MAFSLTSVIAIRASISDAGEDLLWFYSGIQFYYISKENPTSRRHRQDRYRTVGNLYGFTRILWRCANNHDRGAWTVMEVPWDLRTKERTKKVVYLLPWLWRIYDQENGIFWRSIRLDDGCYCSRHLGMRTTRTIFSCAHFEFLVQNCLFVLTAIFRSPMMIAISCDLHWVLALSSEL